jgi:hypothetical protein
MKFLHDNMATADAHADVLPERLPVTEDDLRECYRQHLEESKFAEKLVGFVSPAGGESEGSSEVSLRKVFCE